MSKVLSEWFVILAIQKKKRNLLNIKAWFLVGVEKCTHGPSLSAMLSTVRALKLH